MNCFKISPMKSCVWNVDFTFKMEPWYAKINFTYGIETIHIRNIIFTCEIPCEIFERQQQQQQQQQ